MGADKSGENTPNAPTFICPNCLPKPKSLEMKKRLDWASIVRALFQSEILFMFGNLFSKKQNRENYLAAWGKKSETEPSVLSLSSLNLFPEESCDKKYDISGSSDIAKNREKFLPNRFNSTVICAGSTVSKFDKYMYLFPFLSTELGFF